MGAKYMYYITERHIQNMSRRADTKLIMIPLGVLLPKTWGLTEKTSATMKNDTYKV